MLLNVDRLLVVNKAITNLPAVFSLLLTQSLRNALYSGTTSADITFWVIKIVTSPR